VRWSLVDRFKMPTAGQASRVLTLLGVGCGAMSVGCSYGLFQTARTEPPGTVGGHIGQTVVFNEIDDEQERGGLSNTGMEPELRVGITDRLDLGVGPLHRTGTRADVKYNFMGPREDLALAVRTGGGFGSEHKAYTALAGVIASYRLVAELEPYAAAIFANYWVTSYPAADAELGPHERLVEATGTGDGLLQLTVGLQAPAGTGRSFMIELSRWYPMQNDPGDFYKFLPTTVVGAGFRFGAADPVRAERARERERAERRWAEPEQVERRERRAPSAASPAGSKTVASVRVPPPQPGGERAEHEPEAADSSARCTRADAAAVKRDYEEGVRLLEASRDGEYYRTDLFGRAMAHLASAARAGHKEAQYLFGSTLFGFMFTSEPPRADQEQDYVMALACLVSAGRRGHAKARDYIPGLTELELDEAGSVTGPLPEPLDSLPEGWVARALQQAESLGDDCLE
jgi:hypothetical protein